MAVMVVTQFLMPISNETMIEGTRGTMQYIASYYPISKVIIITDATIETALTRHYRNDVTGCV